MSRSEILDNEQLLEEKAIEFNQRRTAVLLSLTLADLLPNTPMLFGIHHIGTGGQVIQSSLQNRLFDAEQRLLDELFPDYRKNSHSIIQKITEHDGDFQTVFACATNRFTLDFCVRFCDSRGYIDWPKLVQFNSGNYDLDKFLP